MRRKIDTATGKAAVRAACAGDSSRATLATAVRYLLEELAERAPGNTVEVRVPPFGAVQCVAGPTHKRGTPPNEIEADPQTFIALATGSLAWSDAKAKHLISSSGTRADLSPLLPLV